MNKFRILILYPNGKLMNPPPISIGIFTALLREEGFELDLFDTTLYSNHNERGSDDAKKENLQVRPFDYGTRGVTLKETPIEDDLVKKVKSFNPDLIIISILECTYSMALLLINALKPFSIPVLAGGIFSTFRSDKILSHKNVDMACMGEGEGALIELCRRIANGKDYSDVLNLLVKKNGNIIRNSIRPPVDINNLPVPDYSLFEKERFFRPMAGRVYKTIPIETNRGCPYTCSFCNSPSMAKLYKESHYTFFRSKKIQVIENEIKTLRREWNAEYIYFTSDNFLVGPESVFDEFIEMYKDIHLPFWMQTRPEIVTSDRMKKLKTVGCHRMSLGLEHGNAEFRKRVLKKRFENKDIIRASNIIADAGIPLTINNIIGFPDETRELIFDTIELNRQLVSDTTNCAVFAPFHGTPLQRVCIEKGYVPDDFIFGSINVDAPLNMPQLLREEIMGLRRTFALYVGLSKDYWPKIRVAEKFDREGNKAFSELSKIYQERHFT